MKSFFAGKVALITGASSGIGRAISLALGAEGAGLWLVSQEDKALDEVAALARASAPHVTSTQADLTVDDDIESLVGSLFQELKHLDVLVHSAGVIALGGMDTASIKDLDWQYRTNVRAPYRLTQALLPLLRECQGQVVFINSTAGRVSRAGVGQYSATKHALKAVADSLREEVNAEGIRVLSVFPGRTATPMQSILHQKEGKPYRPERLMQPEDVAAIVLNALALPKTAEVTEISIRPMMKPV